MNKPTIMLVEDEKTICDFLKIQLETNGYKVISVSNGRKAMGLVSSHCPDLVLLDLGLPDLDGMEVLAAIREWSKLPIIIVSARQDEKNIVSALDNGADDYITKPFNNSILMARIRSVLRKGITVKPDQNRLIQTFDQGRLRIDYDRRLVLENEKEIHLTPVEYKIMTILSQNAGRVITYDALLNELWGPYSGDNRILRVNMANLRRKIELNSADPKYILTEIGIGYRMIEADE